VITVVNNKKERFMKPLAKFFCLAVALVATSNILSATVIGTATFTCLTDQSAACLALGNQMEVRVTDLAPVGQVDLRFLNTGPTDSIITTIYFDTGNTSLLSSIASIVAITGNVSFEDTSPGGVLPGGNGNPVLFSTDFSADRTSQGGVTNGINVGEELSIIFNLAPGATPSDVLGNLGGALDLSKLRIGIHVQSIDGQGFPSGASRGMITSPNAVVPEPSAYLLGGVALSFLGFLRRRQK
jgi:hypothetical protein